MSAKASGSNATPNGSAKSRPGHTDGSSGRAYTEEQKLAVVRIRRCSPTAFYDILGIETEKKTVDDAGIKKAYRKQSLLTHPDKNGYDGADEAFKMISRAFQILSDPDKKRSFDQYGVDPDNRFSGASAAASNPFSGFARSQAAGQGGRRGMFEEEISPEELFRQFFGGGLGGGFGGPFGGGLFDSGPGFVFNLGGGPGVRVHQFGGGRPRRRPPGQPGDATGNEPPRTALSALMSLLPLLVLFIIPLLSSLFSGSSSSGTSSYNRFPAFSIDIPQPPHLTTLHTSASLKIPYYVSSNDVAEYSARKWRGLDTAVENTLISQLQSSCQVEYRRKEAAIDAATGWFWPDREKMEEAQRLEMRSCERLTKLSGGNYRL